VPTDLSTSLLLFDHQRNETRRDAAITITLLLIEIISRETGKGIMQLTLALALGTVLVSAILPPIESDIEKEKEKEKVREIQGTCVS